MNSLHDWLSTLGLDRYRAVFDAQEIDMESALLLSDADLREMKIPLGPRRKLLRAFEQIVQDAGSGPPDQGGLAGLDIAEHRHMTVMFADLVGWAELSYRLTVEECREVLRLYHALGEQCVHTYGGWVAQYLGDGIMAYFGYPRVHQDDAQRAVRAALAIIREMENLNRKVPAAASGWLSVRVGIHSGPTIIDTVVLDPRHELLAHSHVPSIASRVQSVAEPNTVVMSDTTYQLCEGWFDCTDLGHPPFKGFERSPLRLWRVNGVLANGNRFEGMSKHGLTPFTGRHSELETLCSHWRQARQGQGHCVVLEGDAGIGKSRLLFALFERIRDDQPAAVRAQCVENFSNTPWYPIMEALRRSMGIDADDTLEVALEKLRSTLEDRFMRTRHEVKLMCALLSVPFEAQLGPLQLTADRQKFETQRFLIDLFRVMAERKAHLLIMEDVHWADATTLQFLRMLAEQIGKLPGLLVLTQRAGTNGNWPQGATTTRIEVQALDRATSAQLVRALYPTRVMPDALVDFIVTRSDGVPYHMEALTRRLTEPDICRDLGDRLEVIGDLEGIPIPESLEDFLMSRLTGDRLARSLARCGAALGREFLLSLLGEIAGMKPDQVARGIGQLVDEGVVTVRYTPEGELCGFQHALMRDAAYASLTKGARKQLHARVGRALIARSEARPNNPANPEVIARHLSLAEEYASAVPYWLAAGNQAAVRSANVEARDLLMRGLTDVEKMEPGPAASGLELGLLTSLGPILVAIKGYGAEDVERTYGRALALSEHAADDHQLFAIIRGQYQYLLLRADYRAATTHAERLVRIAEAADDNVLRVDASTCYGLTALYKGRFGEACEWLLKPCEPYDPSAHFSHAMQSSVFIGIVTPTYLARALWFTGKYARALQLCESSLQSAEKAGLVLSQAQVLGMVALLHHMLRDVPATETTCARLNDLSHAQHLPYWQALADALRGWALMESGAPEQALDLVSGAIQRYHRTGAMLGESWMQLLQSECLQRLGRWQPAQQAIIDAEAHAEGTGERYYSAEIERLKGELAARRDDGVQAGRPEEHFTAAMRIAREQGALSLELRAALSLARWHQARGQPDRATQVLAPVRSSFAPAEGCVDLQEADTLLQQLGFRDRGQAGLQ